MNEASQKRHERIEELLRADEIHTGSPLEDVATALVVLLEESVVQAQRLEMLELAMEERRQSSAA